MDFLSFLPAGLPAPLRGFVGVVILLHILAFLYLVYGIIREATGKMARLKRI